jgi:hypothetical protein
MSGSAVISRSGDTVRLRRRAPVAMVAPKHSRASQIPTDQRFSSRTKWTERTRPATERLTTVPRGATTFRAQIWLGRDPGGARARACAICHRSVDCPRAGVGKHGTDDRVIFENVYLS